MRFQVLQVRHRVLFNLGMAMAGFALAAVVTASAQEAAFSVASLKRVPDFRLGSDTASTAQFRVRGDTVRCVCTMRELISRAYGIVTGEFPVMIDRSRVLDGPSWLAVERYALTAKLPEAAGATQVPEMLRNLLAERVQLSVRLESRPAQVYELVVASGGLKMKPAIPPAESPRETPSGPLDLPFLSWGSVKSGRMHIEGRMTIGKFVSMISPTDIGRPVVDRTGLSGEYEFLLDATYPDRMLAEEEIPAEYRLPNGKTIPGHAPTIFAAIQSLGLKFQPKQGAIEHVLVERVERNPLEN